MYKRLKKDTKWTIQELGKFNINSLKAEVLNFSEEWSLDQSRQDIGDTHKNTEMYRICATEYDWEPGKPINTIKYNSFKSSESVNELLDIYKQLAYYYCGKVIRCEVIKLKANSEVLKHTDGGALLHYSRRIHVPLITNDKITFTVFDNTVNMKEGVWYEINNQLPHSVSNPTDTDRVHLIIDVLPDDMINYGLGENNE